MTKNEIKENLLSENFFKTNMALLDGDEETRKNFHELLGEQDQDKAKEIYERLRKEEIKRNDVQVGNLVITTSGITELCRTLRILLEEQK